MNDEVHLAAQEHLVVLKRQTGSAAENRDGGTLCAFAPVGSKERLKFKAGLYQATVLWPML